MHIYKCSIYLFKKVVSGVKSHPPLKSRFNNSLRKQNLWTLKDSNAYQSITHPINKQMGTSMHHSYFHPTELKVCKIITLSLLSHNLNSMN